MNKIIKNEMWSLTDNKTDGVDIQIKPAVEYYAKNDTLLLTNKMKDKNHFGDVYLTRK